jgi:hypothetical protein
VLRRRSSGNNRPRSNCRTEYLPFALATGLRALAGARVRVRSATLVSGYWCAGEGVFLVAAVSVPARLGPGRGCSRLPIRAGVLAVFSRRSGARPEAAGGCHCRVCGWRLGFPRLRFWGWSFSLPSASGFAMTRHPGTGAARERRVARANLLKREQLKKNPFDPVAVRRRRIRMSKVSTAACGKSV